MISESTAEYHHQSNSTNIRDKGSRFLYCTPAGNINYYGAAHYCFGMNEIRYNLPWHAQSKERIHSLVSSFERSYIAGVIAFVLLLILCLILSIGFLQASDCGVNEQHKKWKCDTYPDWYNTIESYVGLAVLFLSPLALAISCVHSCDRQGLKKALERVPVNGIYRGRQVDETGRNSLPTTYHLWFIPNDKGRNWTITGYGSNNISGRFEITTGSLQRSGQASWQEARGVSTPVCVDGLYVLTLKSFAMVQPGLTLKLHHSFGPVDTVVQSE